MQNSKSVKAPFILMYTALRVGSHTKYSTWFRLVLYLSLNPTPHAVVTYIICDDTLTNSLELSTPSIKTDIIIHNFTET